MAAAARWRRRHPGRPIPRAIASSYRHREDRRGNRGGCQSSATPNPGCPHMPLTCPRR